MELFNKRDTAGLTYNYMLFFLGVFMPAFIVSDLKNESSICFVVLNGIDNIKIRNWLCYHSKKINDRYGVLCEIWNVERGTNLFRHKQIYISKDKQTI